MFGLPTMSRRESAKALSWMVLAALMMGGLIACVSSAKSQRDAPPMGGEEEAGGEIERGGKSTTGGVPATGGSPGTNPTSNISIEFGRKQFGSDYAQQNSVPAGGTLFSVWTKIPDPGTTYPWHRGNMDVYYLIGQNWYLRCLVGNMGVNSPTDASYNANSMLFGNKGNALNDGGTWIADYTPYWEPGLREAPLRDWVWAAWQVVVNADSFTLRQWLKVGITGAVFAAGESHPTFAEVRPVLVQNGWKQAQVNSWVPADAIAFQIGSDNGYLTHARMVGRNTIPTLAELDAMARNAAPDPSMWGDYALEWVNGAADLRDRGGKNHHLTLPSKGTLYPGPEGPRW